MRDDRAMQGVVETEVKLPVADLAEITQRLRVAGFKPSVDRLLEVNTLYDNSNRDLRRSGSILRLRKAAHKHLLTWKSRGTAKRHKAREELETDIGSMEVLHLIFGELGYTPVFRYEKYRTEFRNLGDNAGVATVDETPIGSFLELEGPGEWIDKMAGRLGFSAHDYILDSYGALYLAHCARSGVQPGNMVFAS